MQVRSARARLISLPFLKAGHAPSSENTEQSRRMPADVPAVRRRVLRRALVNEFLDELPLHGRELVLHGPGQDEPG